MKFYQASAKKYATLLTLAVVTLLAYGLFTFQHGYYWDDWAFSWTRAHLGFSGFLDQFSVNRPLRAYWEGILTPILGVNPALWQIYTLLMRWATAVAVWILLKTLWAEKKWQTALTALFFLVYPGFTQTPLAVTYQFFWTLLLLFFISLILMIQSARSPKLRALKIIISLAISALSLFGLEYLFGLELLRPLFLFLALKSTPKRFKKTVLFYVPYFLLLIIYLYWRIFFYDSGIYTASISGISFSGIWMQILDAVPQVSLGAWLKVWVQPFNPESGLSPRLALVVGFILLAGTFFLARYLKFISARKEKNTSLRGSTTTEAISETARETASQKDARSDRVSEFNLDWILLSFALILSAGIPFYIGNFPIKLTFPEDRFTWSFIFGVSMFLTWLFSLIKNETQRFTLAGLLISLAITTQIYNGDIYRREWRLQQLFSQQLFWRAPYIEKGTLILAEDDGVFPHSDDEAFSFLVNWAYNPNQKDRKLDYEYFYLSGRLGAEIPSLKSGEPVFKDHYSATFEGNIDKVLLLHFSPPSCLRILDPVYDKDVFITPRDVDDVQMGSLTLPRVLEPALALSNPRELINKNNDNFNPPAWLFGAEPEHNWCYYFEKADLARQEENWEKVAKLGDTAFAIPYSPADAAEYLPFIEAYARLGRYDDAQELTEIALDRNPALRPMFCSLWQRVDEQVPSQNHARSVESYCP